MDAQGKIWIDGRFVEWGDAKVDFVSSSFQYGFSVFEGIRAYKTAKGPAIFRLDAHIDRLFNSAKIIGLDVQMDRKTVMDACCEAVILNNFDQCYIRPVVYIPSGGMGLDHRDCKVSVGIATWHWGEYLGKGKLEQGTRVKTSTYTRHHINHTIFNSIYFFDPNGHRLKLACNTGTPEMYQKLDDCKWDMLNEWSRTKRAPRDEAWMHDS